MTCRRLDEHVAIVTGSTHGIGLGIARRFAEEGATVVVNDEGAYDGAAIADELDGEATYVEADVRDPDAVERLVETAVEEYGRIDVLVNNVGEATQDYLTEVTIAEWASTFETSLRSAWLATKYALGDMPPGSSIVNVSSRQADATVPRFFPYNVMKAGMEGLTNAMAVELGPIGIRANSIRPGAIYLDDPTDEDLDQDQKVDPLGRWGRPEDVAGVAAFLASDDAGYVTGTAVPVDGGRTSVLSGGQQASKRPSRADLGCSEFESLNR